MKYNFKKIARYFISIPKSIFFNFKVLSFKEALKFPIFVDYKLDCRGVYKGGIKINTKLRTGMIKIGIGGSDAIQGKRSKLFLNKKKDTFIEFNGNAQFSEGITIYVNYGNIIFGNNFISNKNVFISSDEKMTFGDDVLIGWNVNIRDSDGHKIEYEYQNSNINKNVEIGNHVWICSNTDILKGSKIKDGCVIAYRSCVCGLNSSENTLIGGYPAKEIKKHIKWSK